MVPIDPAIGCGYQAIAAVLDLALTKPVDHESTQRFQSSLTQDVGHDRQY